MPSEAKPKLEKTTVLPRMWRLIPPKGYKFDLWSFGRYGLNVILRKIDETKPVKNQED